MACTLIALPYICEKSNLEKLQLHIESLIFVANSPIKISEIKSTLDTCFETSIKSEDIREQIELLQKKYESDDFSIQVVEINSGYQFLTKGAYHNSVGQFLKHLNKKKLSKSALETLSIVAYKQPVTKSDIEQIRGVNCDYAIQKLLEKELVEIKGRSEGPGRPLLYSTGHKFMDYFGLKSIKDLPKLRDLQTTENAIGEPAPIEENVENIQNNSGLEEE